jgi:alginate O-acetyltransferase complex protein AlgI
MWLMAGAIFLGCKWLTFWRASVLVVPTISRVLAYFFLWPGMDARGFLGSAGMLPAVRGILPRTDRDAKKTRDCASPLSGATEPSGNMPDGAGRMPALPNNAGAFFFVIAKILFGASLVFGVARTAPDPMLAGWIGMIGIIFILHFGVFDLAAISWQMAGVNAQPIMRAPVRSTSLSEFWGRRWNGAFNQLVLDIFFRRYARAIGTMPATLAAFLISALIHELVISVPARAGYGLPTAYFLFQGCGVIAQRQLQIRRRMGGWIFTMLIVVAPAFWLFHPPFVKEVMLPFLHAIHAL